jgi:hypothetical protein
MTLYAVRVHDRLTEDDPQHGTVMCADDAIGPWVDMVTGHIEWCWEVCSTLTAVEENATTPPTHGDPQQSPGSAHTDEIERLREERLNELLAKSLASKTVRRRRSPRSNNG